MTTIRCRCAGFSHRLKSTLPMARKLWGKGRKGKRASQSRNRALKTATKEIRMLLQHFANGQSMDIVVDASNDPRDDANRDEEPRNWSEDADTFCMKLAMSSSLIATHKPANFANRGANFTMKNTSCISITCSVALEIVSRPWATILSINDLARIRIIRGC